VLKSQVSALPVAALDSEDERARARESEAGDAGLATQRRFPARLLPCLNYFASCARIRFPFQALQVGAHVRGVLVAQLAILIESLVNDVFQPGGRSGFSRVAETGSRSRISPADHSELSPRKGNIPVAIS